MTQSPVEKLAYQERTRREIIIKSELIPPLPDVVVRVLAMLKDGNTEPRDLEKHLHLDPVLVAKMLALVNSPFYGMQREIRTIKDAVMVLGFRGLKSLLLASGTAKYLQRDYGCYGHDAKGLWKHSLAVASGAKSLATSVGEDIDTREELFVAGLLHDIGKMLLGPYLQDQGIAVEPGREVGAVEVRTIGVDHTEAGALVASKWGLTTLVQDALRHHHGAPATNPNRATAIVRLADHVAHQIGIGYTEDHQHAPVDLAAEMELLELAPDRWTEVREEMEQAALAATAQLDNLCS